jgi:hypothetical protein
MSISSDEVNFLIFRYLAENGERPVQNVDHLIRIMKLTLLLLSTI